MKFKVDTNTVVLENTEELNKGEYNVHTCEFEFTSEYDNLTKVALFTTPYGTTYKVDIVDNKCEIPYEVLSAKCDITIGVYGYNTKDEKLEIRYSPKPTKFTIENGSYRESAENITEPTPTDVEQLESRITSMESKIASGGLYKSDIVDDLTSESADKVLSANQGRILNETIDKTNSTIETLSTNVGANTSEIESVKEELTKKANVSDIPNTSNFITKAVNDLENYYLKTETYTKNEVNSAITTAINNITNGDEVSY